MRDVIRQLRERLRHWAARFFTEDAGSDEAVQARCLDRLRACVDYHRVTFSDLGVSEVGEVIRLLDQGRLAEPAVRGGKARWVKAKASVLGDVVLAQSCVGQQPTGAAEFRERYEQRLTRESRRLSERFAADLSFWEHFTAPRPESPPRLDLYTGRTALACYLLKCLRLAFCQWLRGQRREREVIKAFAETREVRGPGSRVGGLPSGRLARAAGAMFAGLSDDERLMLFWEYDRRPRHSDGKRDPERTRLKLATLLGVNDGHLSRKMRALVDGLPDRFAGACAAEGLSIEDVIDEVNARGSAGDTLRRGIARFLSGQDAKLASRRIDPSTAEVPT